VIAARLLPAGFLLPLLEAAGDVEDPVLSELWSRLLASGVADNKHRRPVFVDVLKRMDHDDAIGFQTIVSDIAAAAPRGLVLRTNVRDVGRLVALQLLTASIDSQPVEIDGAANVGMSEVRITSFGVQFAEAVGIARDDTGAGASDATLS